MDIFVRLFLGFILFIFVMALLTRVQQRSTVYVAIVSRDNNLKTPQILGIYYKQEKAEAKIYQHIKEVSSAVYSEVVKCEINPKRG